ncbi:hypothetical protein ACJ73_04435 [Blastomyces percursus]|uniref:Uncharacterized protein n=1 Tax=Blastomyces percursus TaxID=1658174 RepID=A0A1J9Q814_9EURO|nr:hypothetical protein ACJ73_04435 [Blastomyces percursus]
MREDEEEGRGANRQKKQTKFEGWQKLQKRRTLVVRKGKKGSLFESVSLFGRRTGIFTAPANHRPGKGASCAYYYATLQGETARSEVATGNEAIEQKP